MKISNLRVSSLLTLVLLFGSTTAGAQEPTNERILVTDPELLVRMGFGPDETAFLWSKGSFGGRFAEYLKSQGIEVQQRARAQLASGGGNLAYFTLSARMFQERITGGFTRATSGTTNVFCSAATDPFIEGQLQLPQGANLAILDVWGTDTCAENMEIFLLESCLPRFTAGTETFTVIGMVSSSGTPGNFHVEFLPFLGINSTDCQNHVRVRLDDGSSACHCGPDLVLNKVRAEYTYSVEGAVAVIGPALP